MRQIVAPQRRCGNFRYRLTFRLCRSHKFPHPKQIAPAGNIKLLSLKQTLQESAACLQGSCSFSNLRHYFSQSLQTSITTLAYSHLKNAPNLLTISCPPDITKSGYSSSLNFSNALPFTAMMSAGAPGVSVPKGARPSSAPALEVAV